MQKIRLIPDERQPKEYPEDDEVLRLLKHLDRAYFPEYRDYMVIMLMLDAVLRVGETLSSEIHPLDLPNKSLYLPVDKTKGRTARTVFFSQKTVQELRHWLQFKDRYCESDYLLSSIQGSYFNSLSLCRDRPAQLSPCGSHVEFQPTLPIRGETSAAQAIACVVVISTHSPYTRRDHWCYNYTKNVENFNPLSLCRERPGAQVARGIGGKISTHSPYAGRDTDTAYRAVGSHISTHSPYAGRDNQTCNEHAPSALFQPTLPMQGETKPTRRSTQTRHISTHSPYAGRDVVFWPGLSLII